MSLDLQDKEKWKQMMCWLTNIQPKVKKKLFTLVIVLAFSEYECV